MIITSKFLSSLSSNKTTLMDYNVGDTVYINVDGTPTEFIVINQGNPDINIYDTSCNGTWLMMKDLYLNEQWNENLDNTYSSSLAHRYLNEQFLNKIGKEAQEAILLIKIPYIKSSGYEGNLLQKDNGLLVKGFLLSGIEIGWNLNNNENIFLDGAPLEFFKDLEYFDEKRLTTLNGETLDWWLRTPDKNSEFSTNRVVSVAPQTVEEMPMMFSLVRNINEEEDEEEIEPIVQTVDMPEVTSYVYFDLSAGAITINENNYTGYRYDGNDSAQTISGTLQAGQGYYVYQSDDNINTGFVNGQLILPQYADLYYNGSIWKDYITNNTDVEAVITAWRTAAAARNPANKNISIKGTINATMVIDNLYTTYHTNVGTGSGGIIFKPTTGAESNLKILFKGNNRFGNISYSNKIKDTAHLIFDAYEENATLTVCNILNNASTNHFCSAIGSQDNASTQDAYGIIIDGGTIFSGTNSKDDATAIGAGGNGTGEVIINNGIITAVSSSSGTAIGGGIGKSDVGGPGFVTINNGLIYAYNYSSEYKSSQIGYIPAAAIGGGSSGAAIGTNGNIITINGGEVHALSVGGTAIGGGSSSTKNGGEATININGGTVYAKSIAGIIGDVSAPAGNAIGGGVGGKNGNGGDTTLNIKGSHTKVYAGSIGGGGTINTSGYIGAANVSIENGYIQGQFIMETGAQTDCSFSMTGGIIDNSNITEEYTFLKPNGGALYINNGSAAIDGGSILNCSAENGGAIYISNGNLNFLSGSLNNNYASNEGGAIYISNGSALIGIEDCEDPDHKHPQIKNNFAGAGGGIYVTGGAVEFLCGIITANSSQASIKGDNVSIVGGSFEYAGGNIGDSDSLGIIINGGSMSDSRPNGASLDDSYYCTRKYGIRPVFVFDKDTVINAVTDTIATTNDTYKECLYIESHGTEHINTLVNANTPISAEFDLEITSYSDNSICGVRFKENDSTDVVRMYLLHLFNGFTLGYGNYYSTGENFLQLNTRYKVRTELDQGLQRLYVNDELLLEKTITLSNSNLNLPFYLFASNENGNPVFKSKIKLYGAKFWENNELIRNYKPCLYNSNAGLYDKISKTFFNNQGSGNFDYELK